MPSSKRFLVAAVIAAGCRSHPHAANLPIAAADPTTGAPALTPAVADGSDPHLHTVFLIVMENATWSQLRDSAHAPFLASLMTTAAHAERYTAPPGLHNSLPNYIWLEAGSNYGIRSNNPPAKSHLATTKHLTRLLDDAGVTWKAYEQGITGTLCPLTSHGNYAVKHDQFVYFDDATGGRRAGDEHCIAHERPLTELATDLASAATTPRFVTITPDLCHDMHDSCAPLHDRVRQGDDWLKQTVATIQASAAYQDGGAIFITWDEGDGKDVPIGMLVISPYARAGYASTTAYGHSSTLKTIEEILGVGPLLGGAADPSTKDLAELFTQFP